MDELQYKTEITRIVALFSKDICDVVHERIETYSKENFVCNHCGGKE